MAGKRSKNGSRMKAMGGGMKSKNGTRMKAMGGGAMMKKKNYAKGGRAKLSEGTKAEKALGKALGKSPRMPIAEQERLKELLPKNKVDEAMKKRKKAMGGGMMKKKNYAKGGPARSKMANGGKVVKGPYS
jgi:hypothetical protein